jgi:hypothetical protein
MENDFSHRCCPLFYMDFATSPTVLILGRILQALMATVMASQGLPCIRILFPGWTKRESWRFYGATFGVREHLRSAIGWIPRVLVFRTDLSAPRSIWKQKISVAPNSVCKVEICRTCQF